VRYAKARVIRRNFQRTINSLDETENIYENENSLEAESIAPVARKTALSSNEGTDTRDASEMYLERLTSITFAVCTWLRNASRATHSPSVGGCRDTCAREDAGIHHRG